MSYLVKYLLGVNLSKTMQFMAVLGDLKQKNSLSPNHGGGRQFCRNVGPKIVPTCL